MATTSPLSYDAETHTFIASGKWDVIHLPAIETCLNQIDLSSNQDYQLNGAAIEKLDSAGAWLIANIERKIKKRHANLALVNFKDNQQELIKIVKEKAESQLPKPKKKMNWFAKVGYQASLQFRDVNLYLSFIGNLTYEALRLLRKPLNLRWRYLAAAIYENGYQAMPIIALLSFTIGVVITYQMGIQLRTYGADIYIVDLLGLSILREFGPLLTAIIIAGRTGSAFTAQLGIMKINEEIDALTTMGITPAEILIFPRIVGLMIALPLLTIWANIFGVFGGMVMANNMLNITWLEFMHRFASVIPVKTLIIGLGKTPVFALLIASIGCYEGLMVQGSASSLGRNTTRSVVWGIFFIIISDGIFSIFFSWLNL